MLSNGSKDLFSRAAAAAACQAKVSSEWMERVTQAAMAAGLAPSVDLFYLTRNEFAGGDTGEVRADLQLRLSADLKIGRCASGYVGAVETHGVRLPQSVYQAAFAR